MNHFKRKLTAFTAMLAFLSLSQAATHAFDTGNLAGHVNAHTTNTEIYTEAGNGNAGHVDITSKVAGDVGQVDWRDFNVNANQSVNFGFSAQYQTILNRVLGGQASQIMGKLTSSCAGNADCSTMASSGKVILVNPAGMLFGAGSTVDINSFTASTFDVNGVYNVKTMIDNNLLPAYERALFYAYGPTNGVINGGVLTFTSADCNVTVGDNSYNYGNIKTFLTNKNISFTESSGTLQVNMDSLYDYMRANPNDVETSAFARASENAMINGVSNIYFDSNYNKDNGTFATPQYFGFRDPKTGTTTNLNGNIVLNGTVMSNFKDGKIVDGNNKAIGLVANNVIYRDSMLRTGNNYNWSGSQSFSGVKIVTADGVQFGYLANAAFLNDTVAQDTKTDVSRSIDIDNSNINSTVSNLGLTGEEANYPTAIRSGKIDIYANAANRAGTDIKIKETAIKGTKLINSGDISDGSIQIIASNDVDIANSRITTTNSSASRTVGGSTVNENTYANKGGTLYVYAGKNVDVDKSLIITSGSTNVDGQTEAGKIEINGGMMQDGNVTITDSKLIGDGYARVLTNGEANVTNSLIQAYNSTDTTHRKNLSIVARDGVNLTDADVTATGHATILAGNEITNEAGTVIGDRVLGDVNIKATAQGKSIIDAEGNLIIHGENTTIDNAALVYKTLDFANAAMRGNGTDEGINNVTIKNNSTFTPNSLDETTGRRSMTYDIDLTTNGNMTLENADIKTAAYNLRFNRVDMNDKTSDFVDDGSTGTIGRTDDSQLTSQTKVAYSVTTTPRKALNVNIRSTKGDVTIKDSNVNTWNNITVKADTGNITETNSTLTIDQSDYPNSTTSGFEGKMEINAAKDVSIANSTNTSNGYVNVIAGQNYTQDNSTVEAITNNRVINPGDVTITSTGNSTVKNNSKVKASKKVTISSNGTYTQTSSSVEAGEDAEITSAGDMTLTSSTVDAQKNATLNTTAGNYTQTNSKVNAKDGNAAILAQSTATGKGNVTINGTTSEVNAGNHLSITADKSLSLDAAKIIAGSDAAGYDADDSAQNIGTLTLASNHGSISLTNGTQALSQDSNVVINAASNVDVTGSSKVQGVTDVNITAGGTYNQDASEVNAGNNATITSTGNSTVKNNSKVKASKKVTITSNGTYTQTSSSVEAGEDAEITSAGDMTLTSSTVDAQKNATLNTTAGNYTQTNSKVNAKDGNAAILAQSTATGKGNVTINGTTSTVEAGNNVTITADKTNSITDAIIKAGSDTTGFDADDAPDNVGDLVIASNNGSVKLKGAAKLISEDDDIKIVAKNTIKFGNEANDDIAGTVEIRAVDDVIISSTGNDIIGEKTTMPTIKYGDIYNNDNNDSVDPANGLTFNAAKNNVFTSEDSLRSVNVNYVAGEANKFYTQGDIQFVNSSLEAPNNFVEAGRDVILNNLEIKQATALPENTVTEIYANGSVTTDNVTGETLGAKDAGDYYSYPQSVSANRTGTERTTLDINSTKLKVTTDTVKDSANPDNGSIKLDVKNAANNKAGVELIARNVEALDQDPTNGNFRTGYYRTGTPKWDENIDPKQGPEITLNAVDNQIAIKELYSDKLNLDPNDRKIADTTGGTPTITVKDQGGLNLDPTLNYDGSTPDGFTYDRNYNSKDIVIEGGELTFDEWSEWVPTGREWTTDDGTLHREYESTRNGRIADRTITKTDQEHAITFDNNGNPSEFTLVYDKKSTSVEPGRVINAQDVKNDPSIVPIPAVVEDFIKTKIEDCPPERPITFPTASSTLSSASRTANRLRATLPREQVEISKDSVVADNTADPTGNIMSAAARVDFAQELNESDLSSSTTQSNTNARNSLFGNDDED